MKYPSFSRSLSHFFAMLIVACQPKVTAMTPEEKQHIEILTNVMTTRCVGRYLIDLPDRFVQNAQANARVEGVDIAIEPMRRDQFDLYFSLRKTELQKEKIYGEDASSLLSITAIPDKSGAVFNRSESRESQSARVLELIAWREKYRMRLKISATDMSLARRVYNGDTRKTDIPEKLAHLLNVYERIRGRNEQEIPSESGLCIVNGFVKGPPIENESMQMAFDLRSFPDLYFNFSELGDLHESKSILQRTAQVEKEMGLSGTVTLRKGKLDIHELSYEEWLMKGPTSDRVNGTMFSLHGNETGHGSDKPFVTLQLLSGFRVIQPSELSDAERERRGLYKELERATLSEAEALALWDKVIPTLRPRPGAF
jgi:hypothetical protein